MFLVVSGLNTHTNPFHLRFMFLSPSIHSSKKKVPSRAYIAFDTQDDIELFHTQYHMKQYSDEQSGEWKSLLYIHDSLHFITSLTSK
jgi:hypothetical protein